MSGQANTHEIKDKLNGMRLKYTVIKNCDIERMPTAERYYFYQGIQWIQKKRRSEGKKDNTYLMINTDEPYAEEVIEILKRNGHWG